MKILSYTPKSSPMKLDIMVGDRYKSTVRIPCNIGQEYSYELLRRFVRRMYPSLKGVDFELLLSEKPKFR